MTIIYRQANHIPIQSDEIVTNNPSGPTAGEVGDWKGKYTPELEAKLDDWIKARLSDLGIGFKYTA